MLDATAAVDRNILLSTQSVQFGQSQVFRSPFALRRARGGIGLERS
jgi:hypothetical protein